MPDSVPIYQPAEMGTNALKRLGVALAERRSLGPDEQRMYEIFITDARNRVAVAQHVVQLAVAQLERVFSAVGEFEIVGRVKTRSTLSDKLARTPAEKLPSIYDVAGIRVVHPGGLLAQQIVASTISSIMDDLPEVTRPSKVINRLESPMHGYRAVHLIIWPHGRPVEIQIRTELQHAWAQVMELVGDRWGREPRYGLPVLCDDEAERERRQATVDSLVSFSALIAGHEKHVDGADLARLDLSPVADVLPDDLLHRVDHVRGAMRSLESQHVMGAAVLKEALDQVRRGLEV